MVWNGVERREGSDWRIKLIRVAAILSWLLYIVCLILFHYARPEFDSGVARYYGIQVRNYWDPFYSQPLLYLIWLCSGLSLLSLVVGMGRNRRTSDTRRYNLYLLTAVTVTSGLLITYKIQFS